MNEIHLGETTSNLQHTLSDTRPTIKLNPSSTSGSTKPRWLDLRFTYMVPMLKHTLESNKANKNLNIVTLMQRS